MKLINYTYKNKEGLAAFFKNNCFVEYKTIFIQLFCGIIDLIKIQAILDYISIAHPKAHVIGASTSGEISEGRIMDNQIVVSCSLFKDVRVKTTYVSDTSYGTGESVRNSLFVGEDTKAIVCFTEGLGSDSESFIQGLSAGGSPVMIVGGNAADNNEFRKTFVIRGRDIFESGAVLASLSGRGLIVGNAFSLNWQPLGPEFTITKARKNCVYEINEKPVKDLCREYLGEDTVNNLPGSIIEFPFLKMVDKVPIARSIVAVRDDGAFQYAGNLNEGDKVRFAIGNMDAVLDGANKLQHRVSSYPVEGIFIYSCTARKLFLKSQLAIEMQLLNNIATSSGFFTYGEFFHTNNTHTNQMMNISTTVLTISEDDHAFPRGTLQVPSLKASTIKTLTYLVNRTQGELEEKNAFLDQYKKVVDATGLVSKIDLEGRLTYVNDNLTRISLYPREELVGREVGLLKHKDTPEKVYNDMWKTISSGAVWRGVIKQKKKYGAHYFTDTTILPLINVQGGINEYISVGTDITQLMVQNQQLERQSTDMITGLANRVGCLEDIANIGTRYGAILIDVDNFSVINDLYGFINGDAILKQIADRIRSFVPQLGFQAYRFHSDHFAIIFSERKNYYGKEQIEKLLRRLNEKYFLDGIDVHLTFTIGVAHCTDTPLIHAELALKKAQKQMVPFLEYSAALDDAGLHKENIYWLKSLREAIQCNRIIPYYQPIMNVRTGEIERFEALVRLLQEDGNAVSPFRFLSIAKKSKLYPNITEIMIEKTLEAIVTTHRKIAINLSVEDVLNMDIIEYLLQSIKKHNAGQYFTVEITETEGFENLEEIISLANKIRVMGGEVAIDDFGTGYSNFAYFMKLKPDYIKIDGSIIRNITEDVSARSIAETIVSFSDKLGIKTIAEFVHSRDVLNMVQEIGVDFAQGYFIGEPKPVIDSRNRINGG